MPTHDTPPPHAPETLWWDAEAQTYYAWDGSDDATTPSRRALVSLANERRAAPTSRLATVSIDDVAATLHPVAARALERIGAALARLDPAFDRDWHPEALAGATLDVAEVTRRLLAKASDDVTQRDVESILEDLRTLLVLADFGPVGSHLAAGLAPDRARPAESDAAMSERVRKDVRAELDQLAAARPPMSFDFDFDTLKRSP